MTPEAFIVLIPMAFIALSCYGAIYLDGRMNGKRPRYDGYEMGSDEHLREMQRAIEVFDDGYRSGFKAGVSLMMLCLAILVKMNKRIEVNNGK